MGGRTRPSAARTCARRGRRARSTRCARAAPRARHEARAARAACRCTCGSRPEDEVLVRRAVDDAARRDRERRRDRGSPTPRRARPPRRPQRPAVQLDVAHGVAHHRLHRRLVPHELLGRGGDQLRLAAEPLLDLLALGDPQDRDPERARGGVVAGGDHEPDRPDGRLLVDVGYEEVVRHPAAAAGDEAAAVVVEPLVRLRGRPRGRPAAPGPASKTSSDACLMTGQSSSGTSSSSQTTRAGSG